MPIMKERLKLLIAEHEITITPYSEQDLTDYGYNLRVGPTIQLAEMADGYNNMVDTANPPTYKEFKIPTTGFVLDPMKAYYLTLKQKVESKNYSIELVPNSTLVQTGLTIGLSGSAIPGGDFSTTIAVSVTQPLKIYQDYIIANARFTITDSSGGSFPSGSVIMYSGSIAPYGWAICDGTNGTPDLRNKFILGATTENVGATGGSSTTTLTVDNLPSHNHRVDIDSGKTIPAYENYIEANIGDLTAAFPTNADTSQTDPNSYQIPLYESTPESGGSGESTGVNGYTGYTGSGEAINIMPPYYALMYIMKM